MPYLVAVVHGQPVTTPSSQQTAHSHKFGTPLSSKTGTWKRAGSFAFSSSEKPARIS
ncbi:hypothetical protein [Streptomyces sp. LKA04]|uniref:hypothetical protein n=1 Tax=Streptomyces sp. LKA04 TaxID=3398092 RepID=UPI003A809B52